MSERTTASQVEAVNMVGSGDLGLEVDIPQLAADIEGAATEYDPSNYHGLYVRFVDEGPLITVYRTGKYIITGCSTRANLEDTRKEFLRALSDLGIVNDTEDTSFVLQNVVCTADLGEEVNLSTLAITFGLENTEYEPEQFPGLVYRPESYPGVLLMFANGKVVITGSPDIDTATDAFSHLRSKSIRNETRYDKDRRSDVNSAVRFCVYDRWMSLSTWPREKGRLQPHRPQPPPTPVGLRERYQFPSRYRFHLSH